LLNAVADSVKNVLLMSPTELFLTAVADSTLKLFFFG